MVSLQWTRARASDSRTSASSWRTVMRYAVALPGAASSARSRLYCSTSTVAACADQHTLAQSLYLPLFLLIRGNMDLLPVIVKLGHLQLLTAYRYGRRSPMQHCNRGLISRHPQVKLNEQISGYHC